MTERNKDVFNGMSGLRVLVVEDESLVAMLIEDMLADLGHHVVGTAGSMPAAGKLISDIQADLAILDVNLNGEETYPLASTLQTRNMPFVFATGYGASGIKSEWSDTPVVQKPFQPRALAKAILDATSKVSS